MIRLVWMAALVLAACATAPAVPQNQPAPVCDYFPLAVGDRWVYDGPARPDGSREPITIAITGKKDGFFEQTGGQLISCDSEGLRDQKRLLLQGPIERGHTWKSVVSVGSVEQYEIVDVDGTVTVPAGTFGNTVTTRAKQRIDAQRTLINETTYAPGTGMIRIATVLQEGDREIPQIEIVLRKFTPAAPDESGKAK